MVKLMTELNLGLKSGTYTGKHYMRPLAKAMPLMRKDQSGTGTPCVEKTLIG